MHKRTGIAKSTKHNKKTCRENIPALAMKRLQLLKTDTGTLLKCVIFMKPDILLTSLMIGLYPSTQPGISDRLIIRLLFSFRSLDQEKLISSTTLKSAILTWFKLRQCFSKKDTFTVHIYGRMTRMPVIELELLLKGKPLTLTYQELSSRFMTSKTALGSPNLC